MGFSVAPGAYDRFMGRYAARLAPLLADEAGVAPGARVLDVGCGPGALTAELVRRTGAARVHAVDPEPAFVAAVRDRLPGVDARLGAAEDLPFTDGSVDVALAQLVVPFLADPDRGLREMLRVTCDAGTLAACVWDHAGGTGPLVPFWDAVRDVDPGAVDEAAAPGAAAGDLLRRVRAAGGREPVESRLTVAVPWPSFDAWWEPCTLGVGPAGAYLAALDPDAAVRVRERCRAALPDAPFTLRATAWCVVARA
ncbi:class I SAM-dependent methyltransferase [Cellulomonas sp. 179-A 9B4 NHS]|uniref:class I SAM-dependent methyltransferase n=1 Tax=Cellulomonas sp. 179-A 9B4 NHS TaxID=3142379 RepID=UPI0039A03546